MTNMTFTCVKNELPDTDEELLNRTCPEDTVSIISYDQKEESFHSFSFTYNTRGRDASEDEQKKEQSMIPQYHCSKKQQYASRYGYTRKTTVFISGESTHRRHSRIVNIAGS